MTKCIYCDNEATLYCDYLIALEPKHKNTGGELIGGVESKTFTCDAPICSKHAVSVGHICGGIGDSIDYCKHCYENQEEYKVLFEDDADKERRKIHAEIRCSVMYKVDA